MDRNNCRSEPAFTQSIRENRSCYVSDKCIFSRSGERIGFLPAKQGEFSRSSRRSSPTMVMNGAALALRRRYSLRPFLSTIF